MVAPTALYCTGAALRTGQDAAPAGHGRGKNIVGYAKNKLQNGMTIVTSQFNSIGKNGKFNISRLVPSAYGTSFYQTDSYGFPQSTYTWTDCGGPDWDTPNVWVDGSNEIVASFEFDVGDGLVVLGSANTDEIQSSGNVAQEDVVFELCNGMTFVGNPFPSPVVARELTPNAYGVAFYKVDSYGFPQATYTWTDCGGPDWDTPNVWVDESNEIIGDNITIGSGEGVCILGSSDTDTITIPAPEL